MGQFPHFFPLHLNFPFEFGDALFISANALLERQLEGRQPRFKFGEGLLRLLLPLNQDVSLRVKP